MVLITTGPAVQHIDGTLNPRGLAKIQDS